MKGIIFTEFLELVEGQFGIEMVDTIIDDCDLASGGSYTSVGDYDHKEVVALVQALSNRTETPVPDLLKFYGEHIFGRFVILYPQFFEGGAETAFDFLEGVEGYIHVEVKKLYPNANPPGFDHERPDDQTMILIYHSRRHFEDVAEGLIRGCFKHFGEECALTRDDDDPSGGVRFTLVKEKREP